MFPYGFLPLHQAVPFVILLGISAKISSFRNSFENFCRNSSWDSFRISPGIPCKIPPGVLSENYTGISSDISKFILDILPRLFKKLLLGLLHELTPEFLRDLLSGFLRKILSKFFQFTASGILPETPFMILSISSSGNPPFFSYGILQKNPRILSETATDFFLLFLQKFLRNSRRNF